eukprot:SAG31_NODE_448_length_15557_cov_5.101760_2_plen_3713_part_00
MQSVDTIYNGVTAAQMTVEVIDDDVASVVTSDDAVSVIEGSNATSYQVRLGSEPRQNIVVEVSVESAPSGVDLQLILPLAATGHRLAFNPVNWNIWQTVSVVAVDDVFDEAEGEVSRILHRVVASSSADATYVGVNKTIHAHVGDNDVAQLPDEYEWCAPAFGPASGGTSLCLRPVFVPRCNGTREEEITQRRADFYTMAAANQHTIRCAFAFLSPFEQSAVVPVQSDRVIVDGILNETVLICASPALPFEGNYSVEVYVGENYGVHGWLSAPPFSCVDFHRASFRPSLSAISGGAHILGCVDLTETGRRGVEMLDVNQFQTQCMIFSRHEATIDGILYRNDNSYSIAGSLISRLPYPLVSCISPPADAVSRPCQYICGPTCDRPESGRSVCQYCQPECNVRVHVRSEAYAEEIYYRINDGQDVGNLPSFADTYHSVHLVGQSHTLTYIDTNGGGWTGGYIELLDATSGAVIVPPHFVTASSGSIVVPETGETQGSIQFSCAGYESRGTLPTCPSVLDTCRCHETCSFVCASYSIDVTLNGHQYTGGEVPFEYYDEDAVFSVSPVSGPASGGTNVMLTGISLRVALPNVTICRFADEVNQVVDVYADRVSAAANAIWCRSPLWMFPSYPVTVSVSVALNGQQFQTASSLFTYYENLQVLHILPNHVQVLDTDSERLVQVQFIGYPNPQNVFYRFGDGNGTEAEIIRSDSLTTTVACAMPSCPTVMDLSLFVSVNGQQYSQAPGGFHCMPVVRSFAPTIGPSTGGTVVSVSGIGFVPFGMLCHFGNVSVAATMLPNAVNSTESSSAASANHNLQTCVAPSAAATGGGHLWSVPIRISAGGPLLAGSIDFHYYDIAKPQQVVPSAIPTNGDSRFPSVAVDVQILLQLQLPLMFGSLSAFVGLFDGNILETWTSVRVENGEPARLHFSSSDLTLSEVGDRRLQISLNGQQYTQFDTELNVFDPCAAPFVTSAWPGSGPKEGSSTVISGSNFANIDGLTCSLEMLCQVADSNAFVECGATPSFVPAVFVSDHELQCMMPAHNGSQMPQQIAIAVRNADTISNLCTTPWGITPGSTEAWSTGVVHFRYTEIKAAACHTVYVNEWDALLNRTAPLEGQAGKIQWFLVQSRWNGNGSSIPALHGGDSFVAFDGNDATNGEMYTAVIDLDRQFTDYSRLPDQISVDLPEVEQIVASLSLAASAGSVCANVVDWGSCCRALTSACRQNPSALGKYLVVWKTMRAGEHTINVTAGRVQIQGSPVLVNTVGADLSGHRSQCRMSIADEFVGGFLAGTLFLKDIFGNPRTRTPRIESTTIVSMQMELTTRSDAKDIYWMIVPHGATNMQAEAVAQVDPYTYRDNEIVTTDIRLQTGTYNFVAVSAATTPPLGWHGAEVKFEVWGDVIMDENFRDEYGDPDFGSSAVKTLHVGLYFQLRLHICSEFTRYAVDCDIDQVLTRSYPVLDPEAYTVWLGDEKPEKPGEYIFDVNIRRSGVFMPEVKVNGEWIACFGNQLSINPGPTSAQHSTVLQSLSYEAGQLGLLHVFARDEYGNIREQGGDEIEASLSLGENSYDHGLQSPRGMNDTGTYLIGIRTTESGRYALSVLLNSDLVGGTVHAVRVISSSLNLLSSLYEGSGATTGVAGIETTFNIRACDAYGNHMTDSVLARAYTLEVNPVFDFRITFVARHNETREPNAPNETMRCPTSVEFVPDSMNLFTASYACTLSGVYFTEVQLYDPFEEFGESEVTNFSSSILAGDPSPEKSVAYGPGCNDSKAGVVTFLNIQLVDAFGNENLHNRYKDKLALVYNRSAALPTVWEGHIDLAPEAYYVEYFGHGTFRLFYLFYPSMNYALCATIAGQCIVGKQTNTVAACNTSFCGGGRKSICITKNRLPAPLINSARLSASLIRIIVVFDQPTNRAGDSNCLQLFPAHVLAFIGLESECYWRSASTLVIELASSSNLNMSSVANMERFSPVSSSSGSWSMSDDGFDEIDADSSDWFTFGQLQIMPSANLMAFLQNSKPCQSVVDVLPPKHFINPVAVISGDRIVGACDELQLDCVLSYGGGPDALECMWYVNEYGEQTLQDGRSFSSYIGVVLSQHLSIPAGVLIPNSVYSVTLKVSNSVGKTDLVRWEFQRAGAYVPKVTLPQHLTLRRYDQNFIIRSALQMPPVDCMPDSSTVRYFWQQRKRRDGLAVHLHNTGSKDLLIKQGQLIPNSTYIFELFAWFVAVPFAGQTGLPNAVVTVSALPVQASTSQILDRQGSLGIVTSQPMFKVNADARLVFFATHSESYFSFNSSFYWWTADRHLNLDDISMFPAGRSGANLVVGSRVLTPGKAYHFRLFRNSADHVEFSIHVNRAPARGHFAVHPRTGTALSTPFLLFADQGTGASVWTDDIEDLPVLFQFFLFQNYSNLPLTSLSLYPNVTVFLPDTVDSNPLQLIAEISDQYGATSSVSTDVEVDAVAHAEIADFVDVLEQKLAATKNHDAVLHGVALAALTLNGNFRDSGVRQLQTVSWALQTQREAWQSILHARGVRSHIRSRLLLLLRNIISSEAFHETMQPVLIAALHESIELCGMNHNASSDALMILAHLPMYIGDRVLPLANSDATRLISVLDTMMITGSQLRKQCACPPAVCRIAEPAPTIAGLIEGSAHCPTYGCVEGKCIRTEQKNSTICDRISEHHIYDPLHKTWYRVDCGIGYCHENDMNCHEAKCVGEESSFRCYEGKCGTTQQYVGQTCNNTAESMQEQRVNSWRISSCQALQICTALSATLLATATDVQYGERPLRFDARGFTAGVHRYGMVQLIMPNESQRKLSIMRTADEEWDSQTSSKQAKILRVVHHTNGVSVIEWRQDLMQHSLFSDASRAVGERDQLLVPERNITRSYYGKYVLSVDVQGDLDVVEVRFPNDTLSNCHYHRNCTTFNASLYNTSLSCTVWNFETELWHDDICTLRHASESMDIVCQCSLRAGIKLQFLQVVMRTVANSHGAATTAQRLSFNLKQSSANPSSWLPTAVLLSLWICFCLAIAAAVKRDRRTRHQIYIADVVKRNLSIRRPKREQVFESCSSKCWVSCSQALREGHALLRIFFTGTKPNSTPRTVAMMCIAFGDIAAAAAVLEILLQRQERHMSVPIALLDLLQSQSLTGMTIEPTLRQAIVISILMVPLEILFVRAFNTIGSTPQQQNRASRGEGGRVWTMPTKVTENDPRVLKLQNSARHFLARSRLQKLKDEKIMQSAKDRAAVDAMHIHTKFATATEIGIKFQKLAQHPMGVERHENAHLTKLGGLKTFYSRMRKAQETAGWTDIDRDEISDVVKLREAASERLNRSPLVLTQMDPVPSASERHAQSGDELLEDFAHASSSQIDLSASTSSMREVVEKARSQIHASKSRLWVANERMHEKHVHTIKSMTGALALAYKDDATRKAVEIMTANSIWSPDEFLAVLIKLQRQVKAVLVRRQLEVIQKLAKSKDPFEAILASENKRVIQQEQTQSVHITRRHSHVLCYATAFMWCVACSALIMHVGGAEGNFTRDQAWKWLLCSTCIVLVQVFVEQPARIALTLAASASVRCCCSYTCSYCPQRTSKEHIRKIFEHIDVDRTGTVDKMELLKLLRGLGVQTEDIDSAFHDMAKDDTSMVTFSQFSGWFQEQEKEARARERERLKAETSAAVQMSAKELRLEQRGIIAAAHEHAKSKVAIAKVGEPWDDFDHLTSKQKNTRPTMRDIVQQAALDNE